jgi:cysteine desulfurase
LKDLELLQQDYTFKVHVDAVQAVGKIKDWHLLFKSVDAYTFSGHKFGALKGSGFSFIQNDFDIDPILKGGGQQYGLRSGTENTFSFHSIPLALDYLFDHYNFNEQVAAKRSFEEKLKQVLGNEGEVVGSDDNNRNGNTIYFILYETKAQISSMAFDMAGFDVSNGSACSSGSVKPSRVLLAKGYSDVFAKSAIRVSFSPLLSKEESDSIWNKFEKVLTRFISKN